MSYESARAAFDACIRDNEPLDPWSRLQARLYVWQTNNYGTPQPTLMALGVVEEMGEWMGAKTDEDERDAIADVTIFATQIATCFRLDLGVLVQDALFDVDAYFGLEGSGRLCHVALKNAQGIRGMSDRETARRAMYDALLPILAACKSRNDGLDIGDSEVVDPDVSYLALVSKVAEKVMARKKAELPQVAR